jgi:hypothetical protein
MTKKTKVEIIAEFENKLDHADRISFMNYLIGTMCIELTHKQVAHAAESAYRYTVDYAVKEGKL